MASGTTHAAGAFVRLADLTEAMWQMDFCRAALEAREALSAPFLWHDPEQLQMRVLSVDEGRALESDA